MQIFIEDFDNRFLQVEKTISLGFIKSYIKKICCDNNLTYLPLKIKYMLIVLIDKNVSYCLINKIVNKIYSFISHHISKLTFNIIFFQWINVLNISMMNSVENNICEYFIELYKKYLEEEKCDKLYIYHAKYLLDIKVRNFKQFEYYIKLNVGNTVYFIDIISSKLNKRSFCANFIYN